MHCSLSGIVSNWTLPKRSLYSWCPMIRYDPTIQMSNTTISCSKIARNFRVIFNDQLSFSDHTAKTTWSCRLVLYNNRKSSPYHTDYAAQLLVQALNCDRAWCLVWVHPYTLSRAFRSVNGQCLVTPSQKGTKHFLAHSPALPCWWNDLPNAVQSTTSLSKFKDQLKKDIFC